VPETTETETFDRPADEVFHFLADFGRLAEWDPMFERSERLDDGPIGVGSRFRAVASMLGRQLPLEFTVARYDEPRHVVIHGAGDGVRTTEDITVEPAGTGCEVTYRSAVETDKPDLVERLATPAYTVVGKRAMRGLRDALEDGTDRT
jgi:carbon monoxide dehydrogenase subunit G